VSTITITAGAFAIGMGAYLVLTSRGHESPRSARLVPLLGPATGAAFVTTF
jgi:hypothetical protein